MEFGYGLSNNRFGLICFKTKISNSCYVDQVRAELNFRLMINQLTHKKAGDLSPAFQLFQSEIN
jgi:hypothetical protein